MALTDKLSAIGSAIREKTGKSDLLTLDAMPAEIASITTGGGGTGEADHTMEDYLIDSNGVSLSYYENDRVTQVEPYAFYQNHIKKISMPNVTRVLSYGFNYCYAYNIDLPKLTEIGNHAFDYIYQRTFESDTVTTVGEQPFTNSMVQFISLPNWKTITSGYGLGSTNKLVAAEVPGWEELTGARMISSSHILALYAPNLKSLRTAYGLYGGNQIVAMNFPSLLELTKNRMFSNCSKLEKLDLGNASTLTGLDANSVPNTVNTVVLHYDGVASISYSAADIFRRAQTYPNDPCYIYVPAAQVDAYKAATNWSTLANYIRAIEDYPAEANYVGVIDDASATITADNSPYKGNTNITGIRTNATSVGGSGLNGGFAGCTNLAYANLPEATHIGGFAGCTNLAYVKAPKVKTIGSYAFWQCDNLYELDLPETVTQVDQYAFSHMGKNNNTVIIVRSPAVPTANSEIFYVDSINYFNKPVLYVPEALLSEYENHPYWGRAAGFNTIEGSPYEEV